MCPIHTGLHTTQPSLSRQTRDLELEIGVKLLDRKTRGIALTAAGRVFLDEREDWLAAYNRQRYRRCWMKSFLTIIFLCITCSVTALAQSDYERDTSGFDKQHTEWIATALKSIQTVKVGMTRSDLMKVFTTEGGLEFKSETTSQRTYVYRRCPYIKVDVKMAISGPDRDLPTDKIIETSRPYLDWSIMD